VYTFLRFADGLRINSDSGDAASSGDGSLEKSDLKSDISPVLLNGFQDALKTLTIVLLREMVVDFVDSGFVKPLSRIIGLDK